MLIKSRRDRLFKSLHLRSKGNWREALEMLEKSSVFKASAILSHVKTGHEKVKRKHIFPAKYHTNITRYHTKYHTDFVSFSKCELIFLFCFLDSRLITLR